MAALILVRPGASWTSQGGLFDWTLEFLMSRLSDAEAIERLREIVDENLCSLWMHDFPPQVRHEMVTQLRTGLVSAAEQELPESEYKAAAIRHLQELVDLTYDIEGEWTQN